MPYLTPETIPTDFVCRTYRIPNDMQIVGLVTGALALLTQEQNYEQFGAVTPSEIASAMAEMLVTVNRDSACMIGSIFPFIRATLPPNWLICDGSAYDRVDYPVLYAAYAGTSLILDADTFFVPDLTDKFILCAGASYDEFDEGGLTEVTLTEAQIPAHAHLYTPPTFNVDLETPGAPDVFAAGIGTPTYTGNTGGGEAHTNMPPYIALRYATIAR